MVRFLAMSTTKQPRRGRPKSAESDAHRAAVLSAARTEILERGYAHTTMLDIARAAAASKETLYRWYGTKAGLMAALVAEEGEATLHRVRAALERPADDPALVLTDFAERLLALLVGPWSLAANRASMVDPDLGRTVLLHGRHSVGPVVESYLRDQHQRGRLGVPDPADSFEVLYGLVVRDTQIRALLGEIPPRPEEIRTRASTAVNAFLLLHDPDR